MKDKLKEKYFDIWLQDEDLTHIMNDISDFIFEEIIPSVEKRAYNKGFRLGYEQGTRDFKTSCEVIKDEAIRKGYKKWAKTHTATWETDNLVHDLMGNPEKPIILKKL